MGAAFQFRVAPLYGSGVVAGVEVSVDSGATWYVANTSAPDRKVTWTYSLATSSNGTFSIKSRGFDDSGNIEVAGDGIKVTIK